MTDETIIPYFPEKDKVFPLLLYGTTMGTMNEIGI